MSTLRLLELMTEENREGGMKAKQSGESVSSERRSEWGDEEKR